MTAEQKQPNQRDKDYAADEKVPSSHRSRFMDYSARSPAERTKLLTTATAQERHDQTIPSEGVTKEQVTRVHPMPWWKELVCMLVMGLGVPNGIFTIPIVTTLVGYYVLGSVARAFQILFFVVLLPLALLPQPFYLNLLHGWMAHAIIEYFSYKFCFDYPLMQQSKDNPNPRPQILVAPPHGVFPYGNLLAMLAWPAISGNHFRGLAASSALRMPIFKQLLCSVGTVDASRDTARYHLEHYPYTIGISTGGVAEVFETHNIEGSESTECILLKERVGLIKLAIRTGADLVPCYLFGNTQLLSLTVPGPRNWVEQLSRKLGFAIIIISGRFGLPIPYRKPVFGVSGKRVVTAHIKCEEPTMEQILEVQKELCDNMQTVFDKYKGMYGWENTKLIIK